MSSAGPLAVLVLAVAMLATPAATSARTPAARPAPAFELPTLEDKVSLESLRGHPVLVDFWASWCGPCRKSFPWMNTLEKTYGPKGLAIVAINVDKERRLADAFLRELPPDFTVAFDPSGRTAAAFGVGAMPTSFLIDADGNVIAKHAGFDPRHVEELETRIQEALAR